MTIVQHISNIVRDYLSDSGLKIIPDYAMDYIDFTEQYSTAMPAAFIAYDGFDDVSIYEDSSVVWSHTYRLIINIKRTDLIVQQIKSIRDNLFKEALIDNGQQYRVMVYSGRWLSTEKNVSGFEFTIKAIEC